MQKKILIFLTILLFFITSCNDANKNNNKTSNGKINVVATIFPIYDFTKNIALDNINLQMIIKPGIEIHSFNTTPADVIDIQNADIFIYIGGESEAWAEKIVSSMDTNNKKIVRLIDYVKALDEEIVEGMEHDEYHNHEEEANHNEHENDIEESHTHEGIYDEHIWTSPKNAQLMVTAICNALSEIDADNADIYKSNADKYNQELTVLDEEIRNAVGSSKRKNIVFGDRFPFRYLAEEYGLEYRAPFTGCSSQVDASPKTIAYLINYIKDNKIPYLYYIELSNEKIANTLIEQTGASKLKLHSGQNVSKEEFNSGVTYLSIMRDNLESLKKGLN
ncbi:metal ABC transporter substrate-binding protein [Brachyspira hyodysenteriae]|uniref:metal ABC transporter substrate-binding protein n=1 Tax=Brachyspira hyodysenteriae TaxID=159 RepID=UPI0022CD39D4|nr:metal ABC transporter substrate-binding protein [Brachyspira hyodysenteriae]MCZ9895410.1 metal ABC transporter substrate-binding protein [Brachyspira hyodysenteriae]MCZ9936246.1 metal ABC transporter substrate-binding protein [Brachyspira hyodysenteriae]MCZ9950936.1 metal ABC transporter substrate-binding protein [Brachyspira hyodysenteriae]MCZ9969090.1 metal ABC transporter substrate-binding protein [Brachyspira hyodysenteriae]MCZ9975977.1 metal ABC transporter substrate-binding protein [B